MQHNRQLLPSIEMSRRVNVCALPLSAHEPSLGSALERMQHVAGACDTARLTTVIRLRLKASGWFATLAQERSEGGIGRRVA